MNRSLKIIVVSSGAFPFEPCGPHGEKDWFQLAVHLSRSGFDVEVIDVKIPGRGDVGMEYHEVWNPPPAEHGVNFRYIFRVSAYAILATLTLIRLTREDKIHVIHVHSQFSGSAILLAKKLFRWKMPIVHTIHNPHLLMRPTPWNKLKYILQLILLKKVDHVVVETETGKQQLTRCFDLKSNRISTIPAGIDLASIRNFVNHNIFHRDGFKRVLYVSRISVRKNQTALLEAVPKIVKVCPSTKFVFIGPARPEDRAYLLKLHQFIKDNCISEWVNLAGELSTNQLYKAYLDATVFVFPTLYETQGVVLLEALAFGLPIIASRIGPILDTVSGDRPCAILINPNDVDALADAIIQLLTNDDFREALSSRGKK